VCGAALAGAGQCCQAVASGAQRHLAAAAAQQVDDAVVRQREQPGAKARALRLPAFSGVHHAQPGVLEHLVGLRGQGRAQQAPHKAVQARLVAFVQLLERGGVAAGICGHQHIVGGLGRWLGHVR
jgi:hypothetical protein